MSPLSFKPAGERALARWLPGVGILAVSLCVKLALMYSAHRAGISFLNSDEAARLVFAKNYVETGAISSFDYFWLPLPFMVVGWLASLVNHEFFVATLIVNTLCCFGVYLFQTHSLWCVLKDRRDEAQSGGAFPLVAAILVGLTTPWQTIGSLTGFSEPLSWFGLSGAAWALLQWVRGGRGSTMLPLLTGCFLAIACYTRYEAWLAYVLVEAIVVPMAVVRMREGSPSRRAALALSALSGALVAFAPIWYWCQLNMQAYGDPLRILEFTHRFDTGLSGQARPLATVFQFLSESLARNPLLVVLVALGCMSRRWCRGYTVLFLFPLVNLLALILSVSRSGIPWMVGERALGFFSMTMVAPAALVLGAQLQALKRGLAVTAGAAAIVVAVSLNLGSLFTAPIQSVYPREILTRSAVAAAVRDRSDGRVLRIAIPGTAVWESAGYLIWPRGNDLVPIPAEWPAMSPTDRISWLEANKISILVAAFEEPVEVRTTAKQLYFPDEMVAAIKGIESRRDSIAVCTHGSLPFPPAAPLLEFLKARGGQGPKIGQWCRYLAVVTPGGLLQEGSINETSVEPNPLYYAHQRPSRDRQGLPGDYTLRLEPANYGASTVIQVGRRVWQPKLGGYYVIAFDGETGKVHDVFSSRDGGPYVCRGDDLPFFVYRFD